jgi:hypothetical protein
MGYSRHKTRERQENYFGIKAMISALCPEKCGLFIHGRGLEESRDSTSFDSIVERVLDGIRVCTGYLRRTCAQLHMHASKVGAKVTCDTSPWS